MPEETEPQPVRIALVFTSKAAKDAFMGGLSDGWGEDHCELWWPWREGVSFYDAAEFEVRVPGVDEEDSEP